VPLLQPGLYPKPEEIRDDPLAYHMAKLS